MQAEAGPKPFRICIFDDRRGQQEGHEGDKILAFHPSSAPINSRIAAVGFAQAVMAFASVFDKVWPLQNFHATSLILRQEWNLCVSLTP